MGEHTDGGQDLIGREDLVEEIASVLSGSQYLGAILVGEAGVGKTALARTVARELDGSVAVLPISASPSLRKVPFGALSPYLHSLSINDVGSSVAVYRSIMAHLESSSNGQKKKMPLFLVDDSHELDDNTSVLLSQLIAGRRARVLALARTAPNPSSEFGSLHQDGLLRRYHVRPLGAPEVHELCRRELGGDVLSSVSATLAQTSGGNPMFLLALLRQGKRSGYLGVRNKVWRLVGPAPPLDVSLVDLIKVRFRRRTPEELSVLETLALAEPMPLDALVHCTDRPAVTALQEDGLIAVEGGRDRLVTLSHPLYGEVIRQDVPAGRSLAIRRKVLEVLDHDSSTADGFLRFVAWGLDCGLPPDDKTLLRAAVVANRLHDAEFALRAARAVHEPKLRGNALVEIARAQTTRGNLPYARQIVDEVLDQCESFTLAKEASLLSVALRVRGSNAAERIREDVARWKRITDRIASEMEPPDDPQVAIGLGVSANGHRILESFALNYEGRFQESEKILREVLADPYCSDEVRLAALSLLGEALGSMGKAVEGTQATGEALQIIAAHGHKFVGHSEFVITRHFVSMAHAGLWDEIEELLDTLVRSKASGPSSFTGITELSEGLIALRKGLMGSARTALILGVEGLRESDSNQLMPMALGLAAFACTMVGDTTRAKVYATEFEAGASIGTRQAQLLGKVHVVAANALFQGAARSIEELHVLAKQAATDGMTVLAAVAYELAGRLGDERCFEPLARLTESFEGPEGAVMTAMAKAAVQKDPNALIDAAELAQSSGYLLVAAECLGKAVRYLSQRGEEHKSRTVQQKLNTIIGQLEGLQSPQFEAVRSTSKLTQRELDIARLAGQGYSNRDIAEAQGVSVRTVEGHLYRIFAKLGITSRDELPGADPASIG
ncbi:LuxR family transcriptional regulator [Arthrobacter parietis]|uniref:LuxR family transcriptional regulator n=1 Tax=Arthrobacter parietis TaxID=271434 RepID=A0ABN3B0R0_9MICC